MNFKRLYGAQFAIIIITNSMKQNKKITLSNGLICQIDRNGRVHVHNKKEKRKDLTLDNYICGLISIIIITIVLTITIN